MPYGEFPWYNIVEKESDAVPVDIKDPQNRPCKLTMWWEEENKTQKNRISYADTKNVLQERIINEDGTMSATVTLTKPDGSSAKFEAILKRTGDK